jgi:hypothetical protein
MRIAAVLSLALLGACSFLTEKLTTPEKEQPVATKESYLSSSGVRTELELGPDQKTLMADYVALQRAKLSLETRAEELESQLQSVRAQLVRAEELHLQEQRHHAAADAENDRLQKLLRDRETKILSLHVERNKLQQELLRMRIAALQSQIDEAERHAAQAAAPAGDGK